MEGETQANGFAVTCRNVLVRLALYVRRRCLVLSRRVHLLISLCETIQLLALVLAPEYPSGSALAEPLAQGLRLLGQPGLAAADYGQSGLICVAVVTSLMTGLVLGLGFLFVVFWGLQEYEFQQILSGLSTVPLLGFVSYLVTGVILVSDLLFLPILSDLNYNSKELPYLYPFQVMYMLQVSLVVLCFSSSKLGSRNFAAVSQPLFLLYRKLAYGLFVLSLALFPYLEHRVLHEVTYLLSGGFWAYQLFFMIPYQQELMNEVELGKALMIVWAGVMLIVAGVNSLSGPAFLATHISTNVGVFGVVLLAARAYKTHIQHKDKVSFRFELELRLRWHFQTYQREASQGRIKDSVKLTRELRQKLDTPSISHLCQDAYNRYPSDHYVLMRLLEYFLILKEKNFVKSLLARLQSLHSNLLTHLDIACCESYTLAELTKSKSDSDAAQFLKITTMLTSVKRADEDVTVLFLRLGDLFMMPVLETEEASIVLIRLLAAVDKAKELYENLHHFLNDNEEFMQQYLSFVRFLRDSDQAVTLEARLKNISRAKRSKSHLHDDSIFYQDDQNCVLVISLDKLTSGKILACRGSHHLGYLESELLEGSCLVLIPAIFAAGHAALFKSVHQYRHTSPIYAGHQFVYAVAKDGHLRRVAWKIKLINYEPGKLGALVAFKPVPDGIEIATIENNRISQCTEAFSLVLKASHSQPMLEARMCELETWEDGRSLLQCRGVFGYVDFQTRKWRFISSHYYQVVVMEMRSQVPVQAIPTASKSVLFDFPEQISAGQDSKPQDKPLSSITNNTAAYFSSQKCLLKVYCVLSVISFLASVLAQVGIIVAIKAQQTDLHLDFSFMGLLSDLRTQALLAAVDMCELHELKEVPRGRTEAALRADMVTRANSLETLAEDLLALAGSNSPELTQLDIVWWEVIGDKAIFTKKNSIEIAGTLALALRKAADSSLLDPVTVHSLLRNAPAETQSSLTDLIDGQLDYHKVNNASDRAALITPLLAVYSSLAVLIAIGLAWISLRLSRGRLALWRQASNLDCDTITAYGAWVRQRLEEVHSLDTVQSRVKGSRALRYGLHSRVLALWLCAVVTIAVSAGLFVASYEVAFLGIQEMQYRQPFILYLTSLQQSLLASLIFWQRQVTLPASLQAVTLYPLNTQPASPILSLFHCFQQLAASQLALRSEYSSDLDLSEAHFQFLYGAQESAVPELGRGYSAALSHLKSMASDCLSSPQPYWNSCGSADTLAFALLNSTQTNQSYYRSNGEAAMSQGTANAAQLVVIAAVVGVMCLLGTVLPVCVSVGRLGRLEAQLVPLIVKVAGREQGTRAGVKTTIKSSLP